MRDIIQIISLGGAVSGGNSAKDTVCLFFWLAAIGSPIAYWGVGSIFNAFDLFAWLAVACVWVWSIVMCVDRLVADYNIGKKQVEEWKNSP
jgi:purine-cytosine permease-like protein